jgi:NhaA family Na+:H+ antiporter
MSDTPTLLRPIDRTRDHVRGGETGTGATITVVAYADFLCPYCRRLVQVFRRLRGALGDRIIYAFRHFPNERAHPGAERVARASEAAANQGRFWPMYDWIFSQEPPVPEAALLEQARSLGLDMDRFRADLDSDAVGARVAEDLAEGRANGVTGTPTMFVDGVRYDGAWDFYSILEALDRPVAARLQRSARVFASLPASGGMVLLAAAAVALVCANSPLAPFYQRLIGSEFGIGPPGTTLSLTVGDWFSEGLLAIFFLLVGLEIRREVTAGALVDRAAAVLPVVAAIGGVLAPAAIYLALNPGPTAHGWSIPTATDIAFTLGILALFGAATPPGLRVFVAAFAVVDDVLSVLVLAIFYPRSFEPVWLLACAAGVAALYALNRWRVYQVGPYAVVTAALWVALHIAGIHAALAGVILAAFLPTQPAPAVGPLLAQAATALAALEHAESEAPAKGDLEPIWDWASRNLSAASERLLSPADRIEQAVGPWSSYVILPLFAFSATGVPLILNLSTWENRHVFAGVVLGLVVGKPLGVLLASGIAIKAGVARPPEGVSVRQFIGAACLCGVADTLALLMVDRASFTGGAEVAKIAVLIGSFLAAVLGTAILLSARPAASAGTPVR